MPRLGLPEIIDVPDKTRDDLLKLASTIYRDKLSADLGVDRDTLPSPAQLRSKIDLQQVLVAITQSVPAEAHQRIVEKAIEKQQDKASARLARQLDERGEAEPIEWEQERNKQQRVYRASKQLAD